MDNGDGNSYMNVLGYMKSHGITLAKYYPFIGKRGVARKLRRHEKRKSYKIDGFQEVDMKNEKKVMKILRKEGHILISLWVDDNFDSVRKDIYEGTTIPPKAFHELSDDEICPLLPESESESSEDFIDSSSSDSYSSDLKGPDDYEDEYFDSKESDEDEYIDNKDSAEDSDDEMLERNECHDMILLGMQQLGLSTFESKAFEQQEAARNGTKKPNASIASKGHLR
ncbi:hypothetical protein MLD38_038111 [Melastoma candidum]|uniref:Uncharacterized protein n=1 Tax=Melastoma candidum TaxID=119954 RepID=A0ACB9KYW1_9MYRT|nr:hypothetical protein MLD38_038111 [Melastoma candidum]